MFLTLLFVILSFLISWLVYWLAEKLIHDTHKRALVTVVLVNLVPLGMVMFTDIEIRAVILAYIIETFFIIILGVYEVILATASKWVKLYAWKRLLLTNLPSALFFSTFFMVYALSADNLQNGVVTAGPQVVAADWTWLTAHWDQFLVTLVFFGCYYLYLAYVYRQDLHIDRADLDRTLKNMQVRDNIMFFSTFIFAFLFFVDSRILLVILIMIKIIAYVIALIRQQRNAEFSEFIWVDVAEQLWEKHKLGNKDEKHTIVMSSSSDQEANK